MTKTHHVLSLIRSHADGDHAHFLAVAASIAADAEASGRMKVARDIRLVTDRAKLELERPKPVTPPIRSELSSLIRGAYPDIDLGNLVLSDELRVRIQRIIREHEHRDALLEKNLQPRRKILLSGPPGTGKTMTAAAVAGTLKMPLYTISLDGVITKFMGETAAKLRLIFDAMQDAPGVYFFDEVDALAASRDRDNDVGEARRMLNSFLMLMEEERSSSLILAATNHRNLLDKALFRRFDAALMYEKPSRDNARVLIETRLSMFDLSGLEWDIVLNEAKDLSQNEIISGAEDAARESILDHNGELTTVILTEALRDRQSVRPGA